MLELRQWASGLEEGRPWLLIGKGPTFERRTEFNLDAYATLALNHVVRVQPAMVAHAIDLEVVRDCADDLEQHCQWLLMPRRPHVGCQPQPHQLEHFFDELPVLKRLSDGGRLVWYNLSTSEPVGDSPIVASGTFSSVVALRVLATTGVRSVHLLGIDGGTQYGSSFSELHNKTRLANGQPSFDVQFREIEATTADFGMTVTPLVDALRIFVGTDHDQSVAAAVLEHSLREHSTIPIHVTPLVGPQTTLPAHPQNQPRTTFSFNRFDIPRRCNFQGRAIYLDADMLVFGDVAELADLPLEDAWVLCTHQTKSPGRYSARDTFKAGNQYSVMVLDCSSLRWDVDDIVADLDAGRISYQQLMFEMAIVPPQRIRASIPEPWNHLERYVPGVTRLLHYTVVPTQPWKVDDNPLGALWTQAFRDAVEAGAVDPLDVEVLVEEGLVKRSLTAHLVRSPIRRPSAATAARALADSAQRIGDLEARVRSLEQDLATTRASRFWRLGRRLASLDPRRHRS